MKTLVPITKTEENIYIAGPYQDMEKVPKAAFSKMFYTCEDGKCIVPCLCAMCNFGEDFDRLQCPEHDDVNFVTSGFNPETDMITVRCADSFPLVKTEIELDSYDSNEYCLDRQCRNGVKYKTGDHRGEPMLASDRMDGWNLTKDTVKKCINTNTGQSCNCPQYPYFKTI